MLTNQEKERYQRHLNLPGFGEAAQTKLKQSAVLVIGAGGLGAPVLNYLTAAGVGTIGIIDADTVETSNLQRQVLFNTHELGESKVAIAKDKLLALNPNTVINTWNCFLGKSNGTSIAKGYHLIINCTDNYEARYLSDKLSKEMEIPLVMGSVHNYEGQVSVFNFKGGPSYASIFPKAPDKAQFNQNDLGVLGVLPSVVGSLQASEAIKILTGVGEVLSGTLLVFSLLDNSFRKFKI